MKLEKRSSGEVPEVTPTADKPTQGGNKPVVVYIMILFIAAFLLMALSFLMHQRSNTEALGALQSSMSAMQEIQVSQEQIIELQQKLADADEKIEALQDEVSAGQADLTKQKQQLEEQALKTAALENLYALQQLYSGKQYTSCLELIELMEKQGDPTRLPDTAMSGVTSPSDRYQELKEAVESKLNEQVK